MAYDSSSSFISDGYYSPVDPGEYFSAVNDGTAGMMVHGAYDVDNQDLWDSGYHRLTYYVSVPDGQTGSVKGL
jgi:hypothetical protein